jgi:hypothetical protein
MADQRVAHHAAADGGQQRGNHHAQYVQPLAVAHQIAGNGKSDGADDVDKVGSGHGFLYGLV